MKILPVSFIAPKAVSYKKQEHNSNPIEYTERRNVFAYQDYNISFMGRTPEDFYAQDFNRENMPRTMRDYLDYDYETRQHIPPEQMMREVFRYIDKVDNFEYVKGLYPEEDLFKNLHENNIKSRKGILSEIAVAREVGDAPLLKDGSDNFGMYLLRKIYLEGKTIKEISKDFHEKDVNDEYKDFITEPVTYATLSAYGIKYPKQAFWHSFIHTRDEYKKFFVTLPKNTYVPGVHTGGSHSGSHSSTEVDNDTPRPRKHRMKSHQKTNLENDLNKGSIDEESVKRTVRKRFGKDDPQASFIIKYMSPIMTVAAERVHLSEEMKLFTENEKLNGKSSYEKTMFGRFWKQNPELRRQYSGAIVDTIDMFEDIYGGGGNIAINSNLEQINPKDPDAKILDYVSDEFLELLTYAQGIEGNRNAKYALHNRIQNVMEYKAARRAEEAKNAGTSATVKTMNEKPEQLANENNVEPCILNLKDGNTVRINGSLDDGLDTYLQYKTLFMPSKFAKKYINHIKGNPNTTEKYKLAISIMPILDKIDDSRVMTVEELKDVQNAMDTDFFRRNYMDDLCSSQAITDTLFKVLGDNMAGEAYNFTTLYYHLRLTSDPDNQAVKTIVETITNNKDEINERFEAYTKPLSTQEINKVTNEFMTRLYNYKPNQDSILNSDKQALICMIRDSIKSDKNLRSHFRTFMQNVEFSRHTYIRSLLDHKLSERAKSAKFELSMNLFVGDMINDEDNDNVYLVLISRSNYDRYKDNLSPKIRQVLDAKISYLPADLRLRFERS